MQDEQQAAAALDAIKQDRAKAWPYIEGKLRTGDGGHLLNQASPAQKAELVNLLLAEELDEIDERAVLMVLRNEMGTHLEQVLAAMGEGSVERIRQALHGEQTRMTFEGTLSWRL